ncbi:MAG: tryptophan halogenase family protein [Pseudomonadota bacterium]
MTENDLPNGDTGDTLQKIVIVGGGSAGWMTAAALSQVTATPIVLVESDAIGSVGVGEATIPQIRTFNRALGIDEREFLRETSATFKLGIRFVGWNGPGSDYLHAFGQVGRATGVAGFHHLWLRGRQLGLASAFGDYAINELAARAGKMAMPGGGLPASGVNMPWAYHFDAAKYGAYLRRLAERNGVTRMEGKVAEVVTEADQRSVSAVILDDGREVAGDFFIDCSGFRALLISKLKGSEFYDWDHWLPCNRALTVACRSKRELTPYTTATAHAAGWQWRIPLQHRVGNGVVYCSDYMDDESARAQLLGNIDGNAAAEPRLIRFKTGTRREHWIGNCLAIGLSAGFLEPLESTSIHLIQYSVARFMAMLPRRRMEPSIAAAFNHEISRQWLRIRDFLILHYCANGRVGEAFWDRSRAMSLPATLTSKIEQFRATGHFVREEEELFTEVGWSQVFLGQDVAPNTWHPVVDEMPESALRDLFTGLSTQHKHLVDSMPTHAAFISAYAGTA